MLVYVTIIVRCKQLRSGSQVRTAPQWLEQNCLQASTSSEMADVLRPRLCPTAFSGIHGTGLRFRPLRSEAGCSRVPGDRALDHCPQRSRKFRFAGPRFSGVCLHHGSRCRLPAVHVGGLGRALCLCVGEGFVSTANWVVAEDWEHPQPMRQRTARDFSVRSSASQPWPLPPKAGTLVIVQMSGSCLEGFPATSVMHPSMLKPRHSSPTHSLTPKSQVWEENVVAKPDRQREPHFGEVRGRGFLHGIV